MYPKPLFLLREGPPDRSECVIKPETPEEIYIREEATRRLFAAIGKLTEIQQRRLIAYYFEGMNFRQIAEAEGVITGSVTQSVKAALKKLKGFKA